MEFHVRCMVSVSLYCCMLRGRVLYLVLHVRIHPSLQVTTKRTIKRKPPKPVHPPSTFHLSTNAIHHSAIHLQKTHETTESTPPSTYLTCSILTTPHICVLAFFS